MEKGKKTVYLDIMVGNRFIRQTSYEYCPLFPIDFEKVADYVESKFPSLIGKAYRIYFSNKKV